MTTTLVLGGVRSGKSRHAEALLREEPVVTYVATGAHGDPADPEWAARVAAHRTRRPASWTTLETLDVADAIRSARTPVLVDCLGLWLTRRLDAIGWDRPDAADLLADDVADLVDAWATARVDVVAVSNEVGSGVVPATASGRLFRDALGRLNTDLSRRADRVHLVVAGRVLDLSAAPVVE